MYNGDTMYYLGTTATLFNTVGLQLDLKNRATVGTTVKQCAPVGITVTI